MLPNQLEKVESRIREQLSTPIEQSSVINELNQNVTEIADMAVEISTLSNNTAAIMDELNVQKQQLEKLVSQFKTE
ncbi:hypothetical protein ACOYR1_13955 [Thalassotalea piscium]